jgi:hypothetical protein
MIGLSTPEGDVRYPRSHKFADHLAGRFFVSGISGSFRKTRRKIDLDDEKIIDPTVAMAAKQARRFRKEEQIRQDAQRMFELEQKLQEVGTEMRDDSHC